MYILTALLKVGDILEFFEKVLQQNPINLTLCIQASPYLSMKTKKKLKNEKKK